MSRSQTTREKERQRREAWKKRRRDHTSTLPDLPTQLVTSEQLGLKPLSECILELVEPVSDIHASGDYRRHLAQVLSTRALTDAARRAGVDVPNVV